MKMVKENSLNFYVKVHSKICMVAERCYEKWRPQLVNLVILLMTVMLGGVRSRDQIGYDKKVTTRRTTRRRVRCGLMSMVGMMMLITSCAAMPPGVVDTRLVGKPPSFDEQESHW